MNKQLNNSDLGNISIALQTHLDSLDKSIDEVTGQDKADLQYAKGNFQDIKRKVDDLSNTQNDHYPMSGEFYDNIVFVKTMMQGHERQVAVQYDFDENGEAQW